MKAWQKAGQWAVLVGAASSGCATYSETGAAAGGLLGAATGAVVGSQSGDAAPGAIIGGALGAIGGSLVGAGMDNVERKNQARAVAEQIAADTITPDDVIAMVRSGVADDTIIASIRNRPVAALNPQQVVHLHEQGVTDRVIQAMLDASRRPARTLVVRPRRVIYEPVYVDPGPHISLGFGHYHHPHWHHHCWW
jgi:hypothetical protein